MTLGATPQPLYSIYSSIWSVVSGQFSQYIPGVRHAHTASRWIIKKRVILEGSKGLWNQTNNYEYKTLPNLKMLFPLYFVNSSSCFVFHIFFDVNKSLFYYL